MKTLVIAEVGVNHNGDSSIAKELIDVAYESGADFVKFQVFSAQELSTRNAPKANYQLSSTPNKETHFQMLKSLEITQESYVELRNYAEKLGICCISSAFDMSGVLFLNSLGQNLFKIPSGEITNLPYLRCVGALGASIYLSTGMSTLNEIESAVDVLQKAGTNRSNITILQCTSAYPTPFDEANIRAISTLRDRFNLRVGFSDHTLGTALSIAAVALGAEIIEKHFTLDKRMEGPDHKFSLEPAELKMMISAIRDVEKGLGDGLKRTMPSEMPNRYVSRKSIVARTHIKAGEVLSDLNLTTKRPAAGISPMTWDKIVGTVAARNFNPDDFIE